MKVIEEFIHEFLLYKIFYLVDSLIELPDWLLAVDLEYLYVVWGIDEFKFLSILVDNLKILDEDIFWCASNILLFVEDVFGGGEFDEWEVGDEGL